MKKILILVCIAFIFCSCKKDQSDLSQITTNQMSCPDIKKRTSYLYSKYKQYIVPQQYAKEALSTLSLVPETYLENFFVTNKAKIHVKPTSENIVVNGNIVGGYTSIQKINEGTKSESRTVSDIVSHSYRVPHEFGHNIFKYSQENYEDFVSDLTKLSNTINQSYRSYASNYLNGFKPGDYWRIDEVLAELFDTWYCSEAARRALADKNTGIPAAADFAKKYFLTPVSQDDPIPEYEADPEEQAANTSTTTTATTSQTYQNNQSYQTPQRTRWFRRR